MTEVENTPAGGQAPENRKTIKAFAAASFLNDLGSDIIYPVWPLFVTTFLKANMTALGFIDGLGEAVVSLSQAASGYVSDRIRRRKVFIWTGYLCGSISRLGYAVSTVWSHLIPFRILDRAGKIRSAPRDALVAELSTDRDRGRNFGLLRAMDNLGAVFGILISIALVNLIGFRLLFALASIPSLLSVLIILLFIKEPREKKTKLFRGFAIKDINRNLAVYIILNAVFALGAFSYSFLLIYAKDLGFKSGFVPVLYLVFTAAAALFSLPFGRLSDRTGRKTVLMIAFGLWAGVCVGLIFSRNLVAAGLLFVLYGIHKGALEPVQKTMAAELAPVDYKASVLGTFQMVIGLCALPASLIAGLLWDKLGPTAPFYVSIVLTVLAGLMLFLVKETAPAVTAGSAPDRSR